jgi:hypothetical protein
LEAGSGFGFFAVVSGGVTDYFLAPKSFLGAVPALGDKIDPGLGDTISPGLGDTIEGVFLAGVFGSVDFSLVSCLSKSKMSGPLALAKVSLNVLTSCTLFFLASASEITASWVLPIVRRACIASPMGSSFGASSSA